jgi:site-specific recombinase XerC
MAEKDALLRVCMEPLLYAFQAPRSIASALCEYDEYLQRERGQSARRVRVTLRTLERLLDPIEAPLVALTPELAQSIIREEEERSAAFEPGGEPVRSLALVRARRFFRWAVRRGYVNRNPFAEIVVPLVEVPQTEWLA